LRFRTTGASNESTPTSTSTTTLLRPLSPPPVPNSGTSLPLSPPNTGTTISSAQGLTPSCAPSAVSTDFHYAPLAPVTETELPKPDNECVLVLVLLLSARIVARARHHGLAPPGRRRTLTRQGTRAPRSGLCGQSRRRRAGDRADGTSGPRHSSCALG
jgi:hypothetical protein